MNDEDMCNPPPGPDILQNIETLFSIEDGQDTSRKYFYGFRQLTEITLRGLSSGVNDSGTSIISLQALADLFAYRLKVFPRTQFKDDKNELRLKVNERTIDELTQSCLLPVWDYGKNDRLVQKAFVSLLTQVNGIVENKTLILPA